MAVEPTRGELELLIYGLSDDVAFVWVLVLLGLRGNPPVASGPPSLAEVDDAFESLRRLADAGLLKVGRTEYIDGGAPGSVAPVRHVEQPLDEVQQRVEQACLSGSDWEWSCWVVNSPAGDELARGALESESG